MPYYPPPAASITPISQAAQYTPAVGSGSNRAGTSYTAIAESSAYNGGLLDLLQAARLSDLNSLRAAYVNLRVMSEALAAQHNALIADMKTAGWIV